jgi:hypothetical protein
MLGAILLVPGAFCFIAAWAFRFDNPGMTETQLFNAIGWLPVVAMVIAVPGAMLIHAGVQDYEDPDA